MYTDEIYLQFIKYILIILLFCIILYFCIDLIRKHIIYKKFNNISIKSKKIKKIQQEKEETRYITYFLIYIFSKSKIIKNYSKKYDKYNFLNNENNSLMHFINKLKIGFLCLFLYLIISLINFNLFSLSISFLIFIFGSYLLDISLEIHYKSREKEIDKNLYKAVSLLKASFESGKTINQSITYLTKELDGALKEEFMLIKNDLECGLSFNESISRLNNKYNTKNLKYIYSSLSLTSNTGSNILSILEMMDNELFTRRKLQDEYNSKTGASRLMFKIIVVIPLLIVIFLFLVEKTYFLPLINTKIGLFILITIIFLYLLYISLISKVLKGCYDD